jgi:DNA-directed RNA polymerase sigma subunit (sigma70/sigma32)
MTAPLLTKEERSARMWEEHPLSAAEQALLTRAERTAERQARKLRLLAYIDRARHVDEKTLQQIGDEVGLTRERVRQILLIIEQKPAKTPKVRLSK